jgi:hypothetical protein
MDKVLFPTIDNTGYVLLQYVGEPDIYGRKV